MTTNPRKAHKLVLAALMVSGCAEPERTAILVRAQDIPFSDVPAPIHWLTNHCGPFWITRDGGLTGQMTETETYWLPVVMVGGEFWFQCDQE